MRKKVLSVILGMLMAFPVAAYLPAKAYMLPPYRLEARDLGVVLAPSKPGEEFYKYDGGGIREGIVTEVDGTYYLFYDGAGMCEGPCPGNDYQNHLWRACLAKSTDMMNWTKLGPRLWCGYDVNPALGEAGPQTYKDYWSASSPWVFFSEEDNRWYMYYLGAEGCATAGQDIGTPATNYVTCLATAETEGRAGIEGNWIQENHKPGKEKAVCLYNKIITGATSSPGPVIENPLWKENPEGNMRYMMFYTTGAEIGIARTNDLTSTRDYDRPESEGGWVLDGKALGGGVPGASDGRTAPENAYYYYDEASGWHFLFCNQLSSDYSHADACIVYWAKDPNHWVETQSAVVLDKNNTKDGWATGAIGMPSVAKVSDGVLGMIYDAQPGTATNHVGRQLGLAYFDIPQINDDGQPVGQERPLPDCEPENEPFSGADYVYVDETDPSVTKAGTWVPDGNPASHNSGILYSNEPGAYVEFTFTGTEITYVGQKVFNRGKADIYIDGEKAGTSDAYDAGILYQKDLFTVTGLSSGEHTIKVCYTGTKNDAASGDYIDLDAFVYRDGKGGEAAAPFEALAMNFDGGAFDDENWVLNAQPGNPPLLAGDRFEKTISDYAEGFVSKADFGEGTTVSFDLAVTQAGTPDHVRQYVGVRRGAAGVTGSNDPGVWFGFGPADLMVALTNGTADPANFKILPLPFRLDEMRHMTVTDRGASIVLSYAAEDGQEHVLCTVVSGPNAVLVLNAENTVVFQKEEALLPAGKIDFTAFGSVSAIDNLTVSVNQAIGLYEISENHQITPVQSLGEGRFALSLPKLYGMENYVYLCALYDGEVLADLKRVRADEFNYYKKYVTFDCDGPDFGLKVFLWDGTQNQLPLAGPLAAGGEMVPVFGGQEAFGVSLSALSVDVSGQQVSVSGQVENPVPGGQITVLAARKTVASLENPSKNNLGYVNDFVLAEPDGAFSFSFTLPENMPAEGCSLYISGTGFENKFIRDLATANAPVTKITVSSFPSKTQYLKGEALDVTGGFLKLTDTDGNSYEIPMETDMVYGYDAKNIASQTLTVRYMQNGVSISGENTFVVTVNPPLITQITVSSFPSKTKFAKGEKLDVSGGTLKLTDTDGDSYEIPMETDMVYGYDANRVAAQTLTVRYTKDNISISGENTYKVSVYDTTVNMGSGGGGGTSQKPSRPGPGPVETPVPAPAAALTANQNAAYISGYENGTFGPDNAITRAEVITMLDRLTTFSNLTGKTAEFSDTEGHWAKEAIDKFCEAGIIMGADGLFRPDDAMTRAEFSAVLCRVLGADTASLTSEFPDVRGHFAEGCITYLQTAGVISGYENGTFAPDKFISRAEAVVMLNRVLHISPNSVSVQRFTDVPESHWAYGAIMAAVK